MANVAVDLANFKKMTVPQLREYIRNRGYSTAGNKETLVALAYGLYVTKTPVIPSDAEVIAAKDADYKHRLRAGDETLPDPLAELNDNWLDEHTGMRQWPPTMYWDMCRFLGFTASNDMTNRLIYDYKDGKGYSYFTSGMCLLFVSLFNCNIVPAVETNHVHINNTSHILKISCTVDHKCISCCNITAVYTPTSAKMSTVMFIY